MKYILFLFTLFLSCMNTATAQRFSFNEEARLKGYVHRNDTTYFVFDTQRYGLATPPKRVVLTGAFRNWDQNMDDPSWQMKAVDSHIWMLAVLNKDFVVVPPSMPFKFRLDDGKWLDPPKNATNVEGGNLIFMKGVVPPSLKAELRNDHSVWLQFVGQNVNRPLDVSAYRLTDIRGREIPIAQILPHHADEALIIPSEAINLKKIYYIEVPSLKLKSWCSFDGIWRELYSDKDLGSNISEDARSTTFRLFAPRADYVTLMLFNDSNDSAPYSTYNMTQDEQGVWEAEIPQNLNGVYYLYNVRGVEIPNQPDTFTVSDPYARVQADSFGKSRVWKRTTPATPLKNGRPKMEDVVSYEVHVQDFTDLLPVSPELKGTIPAMVQTGLKNTKGASIGFDHLTNLGINAVHLMPMQEYLNYPDDVWREAFLNDSSMKEMGVNTENYDWGYRITHFFAVESRYRQKGTEFGSERDSFRSLVQSFHDKGIAVLVDFVFNHTGENMENNHWAMTFNGIDMLYYYRTKDFKHIGGYGNETKSEDRPMVQRWIIDQCKHFRDEFGVDGIRIDLAGMTDKQTLKKLRQEMGEDWIIYGEPWISPNDPEFRANPDYSWYKADAPITFFQDDTRNAFKGPTSDPNSKVRDRGFAGGNTDERERAMLGLTNGFPDEVDPNRGINYLDIHDNWALADQFATYDWDGRLGVDEGAFKVAATLLFTSLGPLVLHGGTEFMRSKGAMPDTRGEVIKQTRMGKIYLKGRGDTYNVRVPNQFVWENIGKNKGEKAKDGTSSANNYRDMLAYWQGLIHFRLSDAGKVFRVGMKPRDDYFHFITPTNRGLLGYFVDEKVLVLMNTTGQAATFGDVAFPAGLWRLVADGNKVDYTYGLQGKGSPILGGKTQSIEIPATTAMIWVKK